MSLKSHLKVREEPEGYLKVDVWFPHLEAVPYVLLQTCYLCVGDIYSTCLVCKSDALCC